MPKIVTKSRVTTAITLFAVLFAYQASGLSSTAEKVRARLGN